MNYSIRNLILATAVIALILASLFNGGKIAVVMTMMVYAFAAAMAILAFVARQKRQAFAIGFLIGFAAFFSSNEIWWRKRIRYPLWAFADDQIFVVASSKA